MYYSFHSVLYFVKDEQHNQREDPPIHNARETTSSRRPMHIPTCSGLRTLCAPVHHHIQCPHKHSARCVPARFVRPSLHNPHAVRGRQLVPSDLNREVHVHGSLQLHPGPVFHRFWAPRLNLQANLFVEPHIFIFSGPRA